MTQVPEYQPNGNAMMDYGEPPGPGLGHYLAILWRRKWLMAAVFVLVLTAAAFKVFRTKPLYMATTSIMIEASNRGDVFSGNYLTPSWYQGSHLANHVQLIRSHHMREKVADRVPESLLEHVRALYSEDTTAVTPMRVVGQGGLSTQPVQDTDILMLSITSSSPYLSVALANLYAEIYQEFDLEQSREDVSSVRQFIEEQLNVVGRRLDIAEIGLEEFKKEKRFVNLSAETNALISQHSNLAVALAQTDTELEGIQAQLTHVRHLIDEESAGMSAKLESISSPLVLSFKATLDELEVERANLMMQGYPDSSSLMSKLNRQISDIRIKLAIESKMLLENQGFIEPVGRLKDLWDEALGLETSLIAIEARKKIVEAAITDSRMKLRTLPEVERTFAKLNRDVQADQSVYAMLAQRYEEARIQEAGRVSSVRVVNKAIGAGKIQPRMRRSLSLGLVVAIVLALGFAFGIEYLDTSVRTPEDMERYGLPVLANIPVLPTGKSLRPRWGKQPVTSHLMTHADPSSSGAEAFRVLRTNILFAGATKPCKVIAVTSPGPSEGKSTVAVNLAASLAKAGHRTLIIDADLRAPVLHTVFEHARKPGFTDLVAFEEPPGDVVFRAGMDNLYCLTSGTIPPSPADVLISPKAEGLIEGFRNQFDYVVIDTPPALLAADTAVLSSKVDTLLLVVRSGSTSREALENTLSHLSQSGGNIVGGVMNGLKTSGRYGAYYYYYYSGYAYKYHHARRRKELDLAAEEAKAARV